MALFSLKKAEMPNPADALPGRDAVMPVAEKHYVLGTPMSPPFAEGLEMAMFGMGCFWGAERKSSGRLARRPHHRGSATPRRLHPQLPDLPRGLFTAEHRPRRGAVTGGLRPRDRRAPPVQMLWQALLGGQHDPTQGMRQGNDRRHAVPIGRSSTFSPTNSSAAAAEASLDGRLPGQLLTGASGFGNDHDRDPAGRPSSTTPRTTTSSTSRRTRADTADSGGPGSGARPGSSRPDQAFVCTVLIFR